MTAADDARDQLLAALLVERFAITPRAPRQTPVLTRFRSAEVELNARDGARGRRRLREAASEARHETSRRSA
jgi:hypothetical protein